MVAACNGGTRDRDRARWNIGQLAGDQTDTSPPGPDTTFSPPGPATVHAIHGRAESLNLAAAATVWLCASATAQGR